MSLFRTVRDVVDLAWFEAMSFALRALVAAATLVNGTRPRGMIR